MKAYFDWLNSLVNNNTREFANWESLKWLNPYQADEYIQSRDAFLSAVGENSLFKNTKYYHKQISKGCKICGEGDWSCLFITNKCNANCSYCPASQDNDEIPSTQGLDFASAEEYSNYVKALGFRGVSFSGGEPLLYFERTLEYLKAVKKISNHPIYAWMYTNGILADESKFMLLAKEGLDEIRFDIGATGYRIDQLKKASHIFPNLTVEIPMVPEEKERIKSLLPQLIDAGVSNLNLHHLRLTSHNVRRLHKRNYTIVPAERPLILESELAALEVLQYAKENALDIGINYCSFHFKNRFQKAGYRKIVAEMFRSNDQVISQNGYLRKYDGNSLVYSTIRLFHNPPVGGSFKEYFIENTKYYIQEKEVFSVSKLSLDEQRQIEKLLANEPSEIPADTLLFKIWQYEYIEKGLRDY